MKVLLANDGLLYYKATLWAKSHFMDRLFYSTFTNPDLFRLRHASSVISAKKVEEIKW